ncbi:MAG: anthrone oxygenase family protein [Gemmatimonadota bacterium]
MVTVLIASLCAGIFAGAAIYINAVEHPARVSCGSELAIREFAPSYHRATVMQASLALIGFVASLAAWSQGRDNWVLLGGLLLGSAVPFTLLVVLPTNRRLLDSTLDPRSSEATQLLRL